ncbi:MAG: prefoldin subunit alpha [Candidatus Woesearchaeota archaeon]
MSEEIQKKYVEFQMLQQQMQQLQQQIQKFDTQSEELNTVITALEDFSKLKKDSGMLVPLASGIFAYAELKDTEKVRVNVGSNVSVKKSVKDTIALIKSQISEIDNYKMSMMNNLMQMNQHVHHLQQELMQMAEAEEEKEKKK